jgi:protein-tyrosine phosphatase
MAAALYNHLFSESDATAFSRGLAADGSPISQHAERVLMERGVLPTANSDYRHHVSQNVGADDLERAELVVGITSSHAMSLIMRFPQYATKITVMPEDIPDPYGGSVEEYEICRDMIEKGLILAFGESEDENVQ